MPAFSFFRTLHKIEKINGINLNKLQNNEYASKLLSDMFYLDVSYQLKRRKFIFDNSVSSKRGITSRVALDKSFF